MMTVQQIRGWLLLQPRANTLRVLTQDDQNQEVSVTSGASWMAIAQSISALDPLRVEAFDKEGKLIRAVRPHEENNERPEGETPAPLVLPPGSDPQTLMMLHFADLLAGAYRHSTDVAFDRLVSLFEQSNRRSESLERSLERMERVLAKTYAEQLEAAAAAAAAEPRTDEDTLREMFEGFLSGAQQGKEANSGASNGASNGKAG